MPSLRMCRGSRRRLAARRTPWKSRWIPKRKWPWATIRGGEKTRTDSEGKVTQAWDHDPPATRKLTALGILVLATGALTLIFAAQETSDFWVDGLKWWWQLVRHQFQHIRHLVIYLEQGPTHVGTAPR